MVNNLHGGYVTFVGALIPCILKIASRRKSRHFADRMPQQRDSLTQMGIT